MSNPSLARHVARGSIFMVALRLSFRLIGTISTLILVRLLAPGDFGLVALALSFYQLLDSMTSLSFELALIRLPQIDRTHLDTAWTLNIIRAAMIGAILAASAPEAVYIMRDHRLEPMVFILSAVAFFEGFSNIGLVEFRREMRFDMVFKYQILRKFVSFAVTIPLAFLLRNYWALIVGIVAARLSLLPYSYYLHPYRPRLSFAKVGELFHFSKWLLINNVLSLIDAWAPTLLLGRIAGPATVGVFQISVEIGSLPVSEIAAPVRDPMYSGYSKLGHDIPNLRKQFLDGFGTLLLIVTPLSIGIALTADFIAALCLGTAWADATNLIPLAAIYALLDSIGHFTYNIYLVRNRQGPFIIAYAIVVAIRLPAVVVAGTWWGAQGVVAALACTAAVNAFIWMWTMRPLIDLSFRSLLRVSWRTVVASASMALVLAEFADLRAGNHPFGSVAIHAAMVCLSGAAVQIATQLMLWALCGCPEGPETRMLQLLRAVWARLPIRRGRPSIP